MHSTDNISPVTRIGEFGLMDIGAYNGRGVIPSPLMHGREFIGQIIIKT